MSEYKLANGLRVLYRQEKAAPVVAVCITYHVGSRNEAPGHTGSTHILEHLLFKDSKNFNKQNNKAITDYLEWFGAYMNATTWFDRTNYFEMLPKERLEDALAIEADRLRNSLFSDADLASEMTVVRNEYERSRNNPFELLDEEAMATAFTKHPYRISTIGIKEDIENSTATRLREFYDTFYWPNNATLMVVGDASWSKVSKLIENYFGSIPSSPHKIPAMSTKEPRQTAPRKVSLQKPLGITIGSLYYKIPEGTHKDFVPLFVGTMILAGGFSSRLQKALVDSGLAAELMVFIHPLHDPGVLALTGHVAAGVTPSQVQREMRKVLALFAKEGPSKDEMLRAKERILSQLSAERDGVMAEIRATSEAIAAGDWTLSYRLAEELEKVTAVQIKKIAQKYLIPSNETAAELIDEK